MWRGRRSFRCRNWSDIRTHPCPCPSIVLQERKRETVSDLEQPQWNSELFQKPQTREVASGQRKTRQCISDRFERETSAVHKILKRHHDFMVIVRRHPRLALQQLFSDTFLMWFSRVPDKNTLLAPICATAAAAEKWNEMTRRSDKAKYCKLLSELLQNLTSVWSYGDRVDNKSMT